MRNNLTFIAFDTETTGLDTTDELIEIAGVKFTVNVAPTGQFRPVLVDKFSSLIKPEKLIPAQATAINNITDEMVEKAPSAGEVLTQFTRFCGLSSILVAHNANFDCGFIGRAIGKHRLRSLTNPVIDTLKLSKKIHPQFPSHKLGVIAKRLKNEKKIELTVESENLHRALYDCEVLAQVFTSFLSDIIRPSDWNTKALLTALERFHGPFLTIRND